MALHRFDPALHPPNRKAMKLRPIILNQAHRFRAALSEMMPSLRSANTPFHSGLRGTQSLSIGVHTGPPIGAQKGPPYAMAQGISATPPGAARGGWRAGPGRRPAQRPPTPN